MVFKDRWKEMLNGTAEGVTCEEVKSFMREARLHRWYEVVQKLYERYWLILDDKFSRLCQRLNISPAEHNVRNGNEHGLYLTSCPCFFVDGFPDYVYELLFTDNSPACATVHSVSKAENFLREKGNDAALLLLYVKCADVFAEREQIQQGREQNILVKMGLPTDTKYTSISWDGIDGLTFPQWKMLHLPEFSLTTKSAYSGMINLFRRKGDLKKVDIIKNKYEAYLKRTTPSPEFPIMELEEASRLFDFVLSPEYQQYLIDRNTYREDGKSELYS